MMRHHRSFSNLESTQAMDELKQHIDHEQYEVKDDKFESTFDRYYSKVDEHKDDQEKFE